MQKLALSLMMAVLHFPRRVLNTFTSIEHVFAEKSELVNSIFKSNAIYVKLFLNRNLLTFYHGHSSTDSQNTRTADMKV